ncbi:VPLPA-CTERM sorting domain-containing protein [Rhodovulum sulfidophilum]|uniref:VPLPA-CTERM sorting domain-containing protein n=1 Tax=Rhodovulum sulfidophilum TaxID=35806 RepID=UPI0009532389|nr:VPLPA-CTERM sorting domain-containing protein [Rhodovulum sulfidophilum]MBL3561472.1 VPLPA-CTERM sorting domain-containing protein [Rhodovulum sulfidophilum]MBL3573180.1 VPLPA-CTERM sorting domain-containing protein [Rhodovulum sulfidophilum]MBL3594656.1 VPLPA-CTERM sorting domain-containing protein [Rhodovulum sulfidophilum]MCE8431534.1 VPLPA-CTERM sorting domain-containing protein [Rhodovulum sulfidophilum]MCF4115906.1 VPLPA-CTERM sorting domain-containing protein [Rhodovulum sulfidophilu
MTHAVPAALLGAALVLAAEGAAASTVYGIDFPGGDMSFADRVLRFSPGFGFGGDVAPCNDASLALGVAWAAPDRYLGECSGYVSLGEGGELVLGFADNFLVPSGDDAPDLQIFAGGDHDEHFMAWIGAGTEESGASWHQLTGPAGPVLFGGSLGFDIDSLAGVAPGMRFSLVAIYDMPRYCNRETGRMVYSVGEACGTDNQHLPYDGPWAGVDIYGLGAISTVPAPVPLPATGLMLAAALGGLAALRRRNG